MQVDTEGTKTHNINANTLEEELQTKGVKGEVCMYLDRSWYVQWIVLLQQRRKKSRGGGLSVIRDRKQLSLEYLSKRN